MRVTIWVLLLWTSILVEEPIEFEVSDLIAEDRAKLMKNTLRQESELKQNVLFEPVQEIKLSRSQYQVSGIYPLGVFRSTMTALLTYATELR